MVEKAIQAAAVHSTTFNQFQAALEAVAPMLIAQGMREAATLTSPRIDKAMEDGTDAYVATQLRNIIHVRAQELDHDNNQ